MAYDTIEKRRNYDREWKKENLSRSNRTPLLNLKINTQI